MIKNNRIGHYLIAVNQNIFEFSEGLFKNWLKGSLNN